MQLSRLSIVVTCLCLHAAAVHGSAPGSASTPPDLQLQPTQSPGSVLLRTPNALAGAGVKEFVKHSPAFSLLTIKLEGGSSIRAEAGAMVAMQDVDLRTEWGSSKGQGMFGSCLGPMLSSLTQTVGGMSFCKNIFTGGDSGRGWVSLAPSFPGDIVVHHLNPMAELFIQPGSFLGCWPNIETALATKGFKAMLSGEGPLFIRASGGIHGGKVYLASYGAIEKLLVKDGEVVTVDSGHIVAYEDSLTFSIGIAGQIFFGGEGFVCHFKVRHKGDDKGKEGFVYVQTRNGPRTSSSDH